MSEKMDEKLKYWRMEINDGDSPWNREGSTIGVVAVTAEAAIRTLGVLKEREEIVRVEYGGHVKHVVFPPPCSIPDTSSPTPPE